MNYKKISVIGNPCSGKTTFSRILSQKLLIQLFHVDSLQFLEGMRLRNPDETRRMLTEISNLNSWIIDGVGPLKIIEDRFQKSDLIICIRIPLGRNYWYMLKRQFLGLFMRRSELPRDCFESTPAQTLKLIQNIWNVQKGLWRQLDRIFLEEKYVNKVIYLKSQQEVDDYIRNFNSR